MIRSSYVITAGCIALLVNATPLFASPKVVHTSGQERGNGGDVVICKDGEHRVLSLEMADSYEAHTIRNIPIDLGAADLAPVAKAHLAIDRLNELDPTRAQYFHQAIDQFMTKIWFVQSPLPDLNDTGELHLENNCTIEQIAIHKAPETPNDREYWIRGDFWNDPLFDNDQKAILILHEIVFGKMIEQGHIDSRKTRAFVAYLASPLLSEMDRATYEKFLLIRLGISAHYFSASGWSGQPVTWTSIVYYIPSQMLNFAEAIQYCATIAPNSEVFRDYIGFDTSRDSDRGIPYILARSFLTDLARDQLPTWFDYNQYDEHPDQLQVSTAGIPNVTSAEHVYQTLATTCHCLYSTLNPDVCQAY